MQFIGGKPKTCNVIYVSYKGTNVSVAIFVSVVNYTPIVCDV